MATESILGRAKIPISGDLAQLDKDLSSAKSKVGSAIDGIVGNVQKIGSAALVGVGVLGGAATAAAGALGKLAIDAAPVEGLRDAFAGLAESSGSSMDEMLAALQQGSSGMISQRDLMMSYNSAAQLVSTTFANQLPDAMSYLSKVSASTGQDMGFMLDSLVKGVGRLSPMILDNLGIQVALSEATDRASEMFGLEADALDKSQIQAGMMNVVMEKLAANTAAMPDVSKSAAAGVARLKARFQDTKDTIGLALLPALSRVADIVGDLADRFLPPLIDIFETKLAPVIEGVAEFIGNFVTQLGQTEGIWEALTMAFEGTPFEDLQGGFIQVRDAIQGIIGKVQEIWGVIQPYLEQAWEWISQNVELKDVLIALGVAIGALVIPAIVSIVTAAAPVIAIVAGLIAVVAGLRAAWESDFLGIRTFVEETLAKIKAWWAEHGDEVMAKAKEIYEKVKTGIVTAFNAIRSFIVETLDQIKAWWAEHGDEVIAKAKDIWETIKNTVERFLATIKEIWEVFRLAFEGDWHGFGEKLRELWDRAWERIVAIVNLAWENLKIIVANLIQNIVDFFKNTDWGAVGKGLIDGIIAGVKRGVGALVDAVKAAAKAALDAALGFLGIESPSRVFALEVGLPSAEGWARGLEMGAARLQQATVRLGEASLAGAGLVAPGGGGTFGNGVIVQNYFGDGSVRSEDDIYRIAEEIDYSLQLRSLPRVLD